MANEIVDQDKPEGKDPNLTSEQAARKMQAAMKAQAASDERIITVQLSPQEREHDAEADLFGPRPRQA